MAYNKHTWEYGETITASKLNNMEEGIKTNDTAIGNIPETIEEIQTELEQKANVDGAYESMTVGNAEQLVSTQYTEDQEPYIYRTSGGSADIGNREEDKIIGGSIVWNQLIRNGNFVNTGTWTSSDTVSVANNELTLTPASENANLQQVLANDFVANHKYYVAYTLKPSVAVTATRILFYNMTSSTSWGFSAEKTASANAYNRFGIMFSPSTSGTARINIYADRGNASTSATYVFKNIQIFDLTAMFGTAVADAVYAMEQANAGSGVAWFKAQYPLDYYEYDEGTLKSVEGLASHDMVGFNQWDEEWELGSLNGQGQPTSSTTSIRCKNFIRVLPNTTYCYYNGTGTTQAPWFYDAEQNFIGRNSEYVRSGGTFTTPSNARYMKIALAAVYGTTYKNDICINLHWSGTRDGEYEPYEKRSYALDSTLTLRGIPKIDADGQMYYDGDTYEADGTVTRKYGIMDLGVRTWSYNTSGGYFYTDIAGKKAGNHNLKCAKYVTTTGDSASDMPDKQIKGNATTASIYIKDSAYTDATAFKTAMSGVYLVYELETPTEETAEPYQNPQVVEDWGTEEYVTTGLVAVGHETKYPQNLRDKLQHLPVLAEDDGAYLIQQTGTQMHLVNFRIPKAENLADGTYVLKATVSGGTPTYTWEADQ